jgi:hypothetical protein
MEPWVLTIVHTAFSLDFERARGGCKRVSARVSTVNFRCSERTVCRRDYVFEKFCATPPFVVVVDDYRQEDFKWLLLSA